VRQAIVLGATRSDRDRVGVGGGAGVVVLGAYFLVAGERMFDGRSRELQPLRMAISATLKQVRDSAKRRVLVVAFGVILLGSIVAIGVALADQRWTAVLSRIVALVAFIALAWVLTADWVHASGRSADAPSPPFGARKIHAGSGNLLPDRSDFLSRGEGR
jgi:ABC-type transporter Mla maintaining outer membrane lipid asymmetry permease subunit MlaE